MKAEFYKETTYYADVTFCGKTFTITVDGSDKVSRKLLKTYMKSKITEARFE